MLKNCTSCVVCNYNWHSQYSKYYGKVMLNCLVSVPNNHKACCVLCHKLTLKQWYLWQNILKCFGWCIKGENKPQYVKLWLGC